MSSVPASKAPTHSPSGLIAAYGLALIGARALELALAAYPLPALMASSVAAALIGARVSVELPLPEGPLGQNIRTLGPAFAFGAACVLACLPLAQSFSPISLDGPHLLQVALLMVASATLGWKAEHFFNTFPRAIAAASGLAQAWATGFGALAAGASLWSAGYPQAALVAACLSLASSALSAEHARAPLGLALRWGVFVTSGLLGGGLLGTSWRLGAASPLRRSFGPPAWVMAGALLALAGWRFRQRAAASGAPKAEA